VEPFSKLNTGRWVPPAGATDSQPGLAAPGTSRFTSAAEEPAGTAPPVIVTVREAPAAMVPVVVPNPLRVSISRACGSDTKPPPVVPCSALK
jgi:hypothetical protein